MRFIHIADVHLGMQPDAGFPWSEERGEAIWESFRRIIRLAGREKTDFLLIAGDLFQCQPLLRELKEVNDLFASIPETIVVLIAGNHDYVKRESFYRGFDWADNVVMLLSPEPECVEVPEKKTAVYGCSYDKKRSWKTGWTACGRRENEISSAARARRRCPPHAVESGPHGAGWV